MDYMDAVWIILGMLAIIFGIQAAYRVRHKRTALGTSSLPTSRAGVDSGITGMQSDTNRVREVESREAVKSISEPDRDLQQESVRSSATRVPARLELSPILPQPEVEVPLAASLSVSELVQSEVTEAGAVIAGTETDSLMSKSGTSEEFQQSGEHEPYDVLEEIAQLGQGEVHQIDRLTRYVDHPNSDVRVAVAFALGELAASRHGRGVEVAVAPLSKLSQDANPRVRLQAVTALGKIQSPAVLPLLQEAENHFDNEVRQAARNAFQQLNSTE